MSGGHEQSRADGIRSIGIILLATGLVLLLISLAAAGHWLEPEAQPSKRRHNLAQVERPAGSPETGHAVSGAKTRL